MVSKFAGTAIIRLTSISVLSSWVDADKVHPINKRRFLSEKHAKQSWGVGHSPYGGP